MADATAEALSKCSDNFDYEGMKKRYKEQVESYYSNKRLPVISPYTRKVVNKIKDIIEEKQVLAAAGHSTEHSKYKVADKYEVIERDDQDILIIKRLEPHDPVVEIVPAEDCFDILLNAHLETVHGGKYKILQAISGKYIVPKTSIDFVLAVCEMCLQKGRTKRRVDENTPQTFNSIAQVCIIDMTTQPDNLFTHILLYLDRFTRFILLRPLMSTTAQETAMELIKIFLDFGPPNKIETYNRTFFQKVISLIQTANKKFNIPLVIPMKAPDITANNVMHMLQKWQADNNCRNWAMGCYMVQWNNNSNSINKSFKTPYQSVFNTSIQSFEGNVQENEKCREAELNNDTVIDNDLNPGDMEHNSSAPIVLECDNDSTSQTSLVDDDGDVSIVNEISDDDDDCLITFTEIPTEPASAPAPKKHVAHKRPNLLAKSPSVDSVEDASRNVPAVDKPTTSFKKPNVLWKTFINPRRVKPKKQVKRRDLPAPENTKCHICKTGIKKAYVCTECNRNVHLFCSDRLLQPNTSADVLTVTCTTCRLTNSRLEKLKRKFNQMDGDETNVTIKH